MDIKCRRTICQFNEGHTCCSPKVDISGKAVCKVFEAKEVSEETVDFSKNLFQQTPDYKNSRHIKNLLLECKAKECLFNQEGKCRANGITVVDQDNESKCATFLCDLK